MIFLNKVFLTGKEETYFADALKSSQGVGLLSGDGYYTHAASAFIERAFETPKALLTHSCTAALEMAAILADIRPGDEVIMPSYTFVSTANAFVLRGGVPVFVDIRPDTLNIDETLIEAAITRRTKAIVPVHYAGAACDMDVIMQIAEAYGLLVIEDAAQAVFSKYRGRPLGSIGHLGCYSFHETKNIVCGEGGALLINDTTLVDRAKIIREKGTDRSAFMEGRVDKYTWRDLGSSYLPPDTSAAFLLAQLEVGVETTRIRREAWSAYDARLGPLEALQTPVYAYSVEHNAHMYFGLLQDRDTRSRFIRHMKASGIQTLSHYVPLHNAPAGQKFGRMSGSMGQTEALAERLVRFPMYRGVGPHVEAICDAAHAFFEGSSA